MKKVCMILAAVCMLLAIVFLALSLAAGQGKPLVSQMSDREIDQFMSRYGLEDLVLAKSYDTIREFAIRFERTGAIADGVWGYTAYYELRAALTNALSDYYDRPEATFEITIVD